MSIRIVDSGSLKPADGDEDFRLHCAALEWSLAEPIIINSSDDIKSSVNWKDRVQPFHHQVQNLMRFCRRLPVTLLADDVGLGKTISAGLIVSELMKRNKVKKIFVVCPKILVPQWVEELESKFGILAYGATGSELKSSSRRTEPVIVTTYQSATGFLQNQQAGLFDMLILDEAHKVRNLHGTKEPPQMATAIFKSLQSRMFKYVLMLTATPIQNRLWDIYSLVDCLAVARGHKNPFGTPDQFANRFVADGRNVARRLNPHFAEEFRKIVNSYMFRTRRIDAKLAFPNREVQSYSISVSKEERYLQDLVAANISDFSPLIQVSLLVALMSSPQALATQLENMVVKGDLATTVRIIANSLRVPAKAQMLLKIARDLAKQGSDWRMVVFTTRKETQHMIGETLKDAGMRCGFIMGGEPTKNRSAIEAFRKPKPDINVIVSTDAGAEGVNLQAANILVNYDLPWNPMIVEQRIGRVQRIGSKFKSVWVANLVHENSPEQRIVARLMEKLQVISHTVGDIEAVLDATGDSSGDSLEKQILKMVVASLKGQNQEHAAKLAEESIEQAKKLIETNQKEMDQTLGDPNANKEANEVPMPRLSPALPSVPLKAFVVDALKAEGATVNDRGDGVFTSKSRNVGEERFTFDEDVHQRASQEGVFMGRAPLLYQQGRPAFERLVQRWIDRSSLKLEDNKTNQDDPNQIAAKWTATFQGAVLLDATVSQRRHRFSGYVICRTRVANAVDSYEKLIHLNYDSDSNSKNAASNATVLEPRLGFKLNADGFIETQVESDKDVRLFRDYYETRLKNEMGQSDVGDRGKKLINDLRPSVTVETSAVKGKLTESMSIAVRYRFSKELVYVSNLQIEGGRIVGEPKRQLCDLSKQKLPTDCLEKCAFTGRYALREMLERSEISGEFALPEVFVTCEKTGLRVHRVETDICCKSAKRVCRGELVKSELSGRMALPEYAAKCQITNTIVLDDELVVSSCSGKRIRMDQAISLTGSNDLVHQSEGTQCAYSGNWYRKSDCEFSDVTGKPVSKERTVTSDMSGRKCDVSEIKKCVETGQKLLPDEVGVCTITNKTMDLRLLRLCPVTKKVAANARFEVCQISNQRVLPEALGTCCVTGKKALNTLLVRSDASGKSCLKDQILICEESFAKLLPSEVQLCEATNKRVDVRLLRKCAVSGKVAIESKMAKSQASGNWMLAEYTKTMPNGAIVGVREVAMCYWSLKYLRAEQTAICPLTGLTFEKSQLNASSELAVLRECLDGTNRGSPSPDPGYLARLLPKLFGGVNYFQWISSSHGNTHILFGTKSIYGFNSKVFAVIAHGNPNGLTLRGNIVFGKRSRGVWQLTDKVPLNSK